MCIVKTQGLEALKPKAYAPYGIEVARALKEHLSKDELRDIHRLQPARHFAVLARHVLLTALVAAGLWHFEQPWIWIPLAVLQGFNILGFIILLHEQVHQAIFTESHPRLMRLLGLLYAFPSSISATQFKIWHLDHHNELGSSESDPKRAYLTPKIVTRWYKLLYMTPALFVIYSRAALKEAATYPPETRRVIAWERAIYMTLHIAILASLWVFAGAGVALRVHFVPLFLAFPIAFTLNRLGQHYDIEPSDPLRWSTLINPSPLWDFLFLWSNMHLEHHYFPRVPFYNLKPLNRRLQGFYREHGVPPRTYREILWEWFVKNRVPHTNWFESEGSPSRTATAAASSR
jgi:fatty acid desaturase